MYLRHINKFHYGVHQDMKGTTPLQTAINKAIEMNTTCLQVFLRSPYRRSKLKYPDSKWKQDAREARRLLRKNDMRLFVHAPYNINIADDSYQYSILLDELKCATYAGSTGVVLHVGKCNMPSKNKKLTPKQGIQNMKKNIKHIITLYKQWKWPEMHNKSRAKLLMETAAGQGSELCVRLELLGQLLHDIDDYDYLGICVDTCHVFAAGYNITSDFFKNILDKEFNLSNIYLIHLNDSKGPCGCKKDRHEQFGQGHIGLEKMQDIVRQSNKYNIPVILETKPPYKSQLNDIIHSLN